MPLEVKMKVGLSWGSLKDYNMSSSSSKVPLGLGGSIFIINVINHIA